MQLGKRDLGTHMHRKKTGRKDCKILTNDYLCMLGLAIIFIFFFTLEYIFQDECKEHQLLLSEKIVLKFTFFKDNPI